MACLLMPNGPLSSYCTLLRDLLAIKLAIYLFSLTIKGCPLATPTDNTTAVHYVNHQGWMVFQKPLPSSTQPLRTLHHPFGVLNGRSSTRSPKCDSRHAEGGGGLRAWVGTELDFPASSLLMVGASRRWCFCHQTQFKMRCILLQGGTNSWQRCHFLAWLHHTLLFIY